MFHVLIRVEVRHLKKHLRFTLKMQNCDAVGAVAVALEKIVHSLYLLGDLKHLTNFNHTGTLEVYHSVQNKYCPKRLHFTYRAMITRGELAALDFNAGVGLQHAKTKEGELRYIQQFSRIT